MYDEGWHAAGIERQLQAMLALPDRTEHARTITAPTTIIAGMVDRLVAHAASQQLHELIPGSTYTLFPGMGHKLPRELWPGLVTQLAENAARAV